MKKKLLLGCYLLLETTLFANMHYELCRWNAPLPVAIDINIKESDSTRYYREYWKLKRIHNSLYIQEINGK